MSTMSGVGARVLALLGVVVALSFVGLPLVESQRQYDAGLYGGLRWRMIGPFRGGRGNGVTGAPSQPNTVYLGFVRGGRGQATKMGPTMRANVRLQAITSHRPVALATANTD